MRIGSGTQLAPPQPHTQANLRDAREIRDRARTPLAGTLTLSCSFLELFYWEGNRFYAFPWTIETPSGQGVNNIRLTADSVEVRPKTPLADDVPR